jgi:hypothetical protein
MTTAASNSLQNRPAQEGVTNHSGHKNEQTSQKGRFARWLGNVEGRFASSIKKAAPSKEESGSGPLLTSSPLSSTLAGPAGAKERPTRDEQEPNVESGEREPNGEPCEAERLDARGEAELLDPMQRVLVQEGNWARFDAAPHVRPRGALATPASAPTLDALVDRFLRRVAFSGGRQRGVAHLEIGSGELAGASLTISSEGGEVELWLDAPPGVDAEPYRARLSKRLEAKGLRALVRVR